MKTWAIAYRPIWGFFTRYIVQIEANSYEAAMMKFYAKYDDNCDAVLHVELCR